MDVPLNPSKKPYKGTSKSRVKPEEVLDRIKKTFTRLNKIEKEDSELRLTVFQDIYIWTGMVVDMGILKNRQEAFNSLKASTGRSATAMRKFYLAGKFMVDYKIRPSNRVEAHAVYTAANIGGRKNVSKANWLKIVSAVKGGKKAGDIARLIRNLKILAGSYGKSRGGALIKNRKLNPTYLKMEAMALCQLMVEYYEISGELAFTDKDGNVRVAANAEFE